MRIELTETVKNIFAGVIIGEVDLKGSERQEKIETFKMCLPLFRGRFLDNIFDEEYAIYYEILTKHKIGMFTESQLRLVIDENVSEILESSVIKLDDIMNSIVDQGIAERASDAEKLEVFTNRACETLKELSNTVVSLDQFKSACEIYCESYKSEQFDKIMSNMAMIKFGAKKLKNSHGKMVEYKGIEGAKKYYRDGIAVLNRIDNVSGSKDTIRDAEWLAQRADKQEGYEEEIVTTGLSEVDSVVGALRRTQMWGVVGPTKGGKTRFTAHLVDRLAEAGYNVAIWILEGSEKEWDSMIESHIIRCDTGISVDTKSIEDNNFTNVVETEESEEKIRQLVQSAEIKYAVGEKRGRVSFINEMAYVETFLDKLTDHYENVNAFDVIVIDTPLLVQSTRGLNKVDRISTAYETLKLYLAHGLPVHIAAICTAQIKQSVIELLRKSPDATLDITAGAEAAATIRTPDMSIGLFSSKEERRAGMMRTYCIASRHSDAFDDFICKCDLGCCYFESDPALYR